MITITQQNKTGFPGLDQALPSNSLVENVLPTIYESGGTFSVNLVFAYIPDSELDTVTDIALSNLSTLSGIEGVTVTLVNSHTINFSGSVDNIFTDAYYRFLMPDNTIKVLPANTEEFYLALIEYSPPVIKRKTFTYSLPCTISYIGAGGGEGGGATGRIINLTLSDTASTLDTLNNSTNSTSSVITATSDSYDAEQYSQISEQYHAYYSTAATINATEIISANDALALPSPAVIITIIEAPSIPSQINTTISVTQDVAWNYNIAVQQFRSVLAEGVI
jgi:hypothetical protein